MKRKDLIIMLAVALMVLSAFMYRLIINKSDNYDRVIIKYQDKTKVYVLPDEPERIEINQGDGIINIIEISKKGVEMVYSTCKNQLCVKQGKMTPGNIKGRATGRFIICLPHKLTVELAKKGDKDV